MRKTIPALVLPLLWALAGCSSADVLGPSTSSGDGKTPSGTGSNDGLARGDTFVETPVLAPHGSEETAMDRGGVRALDPSLVDRYTRAPGPVNVPDGRPQPTQVASNLGNLGGLTVAEGVVLYVADGQVRAVPHEGVSLRPVGQRIPAQASLAADGKGIFFLDGQGSLLRTDRETTETSVMFATHGPGFALGMRGSTLFWVERDDVLGDQIFGGRPGDPGSRVLATSSAGIRATAVASDYIYFTTHDGRVVRTSRVPGCAGASCTLEIARGQAGPGAIAVNDGNVWWTTSDGQLRTASLVDGAVDTVAVVDGSLRNLVADARGVYFSVDTASGSWVGWSANASRHAVGLASHRTGIETLVADDEALYWSDRQLGAVFRLRK